MKKAFLVCGAQRSGTRMLTHAIAAAGAVYLPLNFGEKFGDPHVQLERAMKNHENVVLHFSLPKQQHWPDVEAFRKQLEQQGYAVRPVGIMRDWHANISSMMAPHFVSDRAHGEIQIRMAWKYLLNTFPDDLLIVTYEAFAGSADVRKRILTVDLGLPKNPERLLAKEMEHKEFENQNSKWY